MATRIYGQSGRPSGVAGTVADTSVIDARIDLKNPFVNKPGVDSLFLAAGTTGLALSNSTTSFAGLDIYTTILGAYEPEFASPRGLWATAVGANAGANSTANYCSVYKCLPVFLW